nr:tyrosine-type recombinase/integrase [Roseovarius sp. A-2]
MTAYNARAHADLFGNLAHLLPLDDQAGQHVTLAIRQVRFGNMLAEELTNHEVRETYLATEYGKPFASSGSLDNRVRKWIVAAGLVGKDGKANRSQHGIRKGVAEIMAENGATEYELMSAFGWTEAKTASVYTKKFQRRGAAAAASRRLAGAQGGPRLENRGPVSGLSVSKTRENRDSGSP